MQKKCQYLVRTAVKKSTAANSLMKTLLLPLIIPLLLCCGFKNPRTLNGKWIVKEVTYAKAGKTFDETFTQGYFFTFTKENYFETTNSTGTYQGQWQLIGDTLALTAGGKTERMAITYLSRDSLVCSIDLNREVLVFSMKKVRGRHGKKLRSDQGRQPNFSMLPR